MTTMIKCKACNDVISSNARVCPKCGEPQKRKTSNLVKVILVFMGLALVSSVLNLGDRVQPQAPPPSITISAKDLYDAYAANEIAADQKYKGLTAIVEGRVQDISQVFGKGQLSIDAGWGAVPVICILKSENLNQLASLKKGEPVKVKGRISGKTIAVGISDCVIVK